MSFDDEECVFCGRPAHLNVGSEGHGLVTHPEGDPVGRVCENCADEKLDGVPEAEECIVCGADADYARVGLTVERTPEEDVPIVERAGEATPILCETHFEEDRE